MIGVYVLIDFSAPILIQFEPIATVYSFHLMKKEVLLSSFFLLPPSLTLERKSLERER